MRWRTAHRRRRRVEARRQRRERLAQMTALQRQFYNLGRNIRVSVQGMGYLRKAMEEAAVRIRETMPRLIEEALRKNAQFAPRRVEYPHQCVYCGAGSFVDPNDQSPPPDYCHPEDHGEPE